MKYSCNFLLCSVLVSGWLSADASIPAFGQDSSAAAESASAKALPQTLAPLASDQSRLGQSTVNSTDASILDNAQTSLGSDTTVQERVPLLRPDSGSRDLTPALALDEPRLPASNQPVAADRPNSHQPADLTRSEPGASRQSTEPVAGVPPANQSHAAQSSDLSHLNLAALKQTQTLIPNLHIVSPALLRGGQPSDQALQLLQQSGIKTVINLRNEPLLTAQEEAQAKAYGLQYANIPMDIFSRPSDLSVRRFLAIVNDPRNQPVYVHCLHGQDRTGTMCAIYRMTQQSWSFDQAHQEMVAYGFRPLLTQLTQTVYSYAPRDSRPSTLPTGSFVQDLRQRAKNFIK